VGSKPVWQSKRPAENGLRSRDGAGRIDFSSWSGDARAFDARNRAKQIVRKGAQRFIIWPTERERNPSRQETIGKP